MIRAAIATLLLCVAGEMKSPTCLSPVFVADSLCIRNDHAMRDMIIESPATTIYLKEAPAVFRYRDIPYLGSFRCNDQRLNDIWMTGAYTVHLNVQEYLWDGIKRDRLIWLGDMHPEVATIMSIFGYSDVVDKSIGLACKQLPLPQWLNTGVIDRIDECVDEAGNENLAPHLGDLEWAEGIFPTPSGVV